MEVAESKLTLSRATVVNPGLSSSVVVGVSCALLVFVFAVQPFGTSKIASAFAPIVIVWMCFNFTFGVYVSIYSSVKPSQYKLC